MGDSGFNIELSGNKGKASSSLVQQPAKQPKGFKLPHDQQKGMKK
jgi:hypothetical protein